MKYNIDSQLKKFCIKIPFKSPLISISHAPMMLMLKFVKMKGVNVKKASAYGCPVDIVEPDGIDENAPCLVFCHGGGFGFKAAPHHKSLALKLAKEVGCRVICPDYRLLPDHVYPKAREDVIKAYRYACEHFPKSDLAVMGDSAGGTLTTYILYDAEKAGLKAPKLQMLLYPVIDAECVTNSMKIYTDTPLWNAVNNREMWKLYLNGANINEASPMQMELPKNIPDTYIETAEFDCLHDEGIAYAARLTEAGANVEVYQTLGTPHGYDIAGGSKIMKMCMERRVNALKTAFYKSRTVNI